MILKYDRIIHVVSNKSAKMKRRDFIKSATATSAGLIILPASTLAGNGAGSKMNIALIGVYGRARRLWETLKSENVVALCDVHAENMARGAAVFPGAKQYTDWRKCLEQKDIEAVVVCTPDHHHAFISIWAMNRGMHVYCEKPLGDCVFEAREVRRTYLANKHRVATQHGTQRHAYENFDRVAEWVRSGAIGDLLGAKAWGNRTHNKTGYLPGVGSAPKHVDWEQWIGPVQMHPYNPEYLSGNCLQWNMYDDFGSWQVGDMGSHTVDLAWNAIDAEIPTLAEASGDPWNPEVCPSDHHSRFIFPANDWRKEISVEWYQGTLKPKAPHKAIDISKIGHGVMFNGTKGAIIADFRTRMLIPAVTGADMTYYDPPARNEVAPPMGDFMGEWITACKTDLQTTCNFDYAACLIETLMLGLTAHRAGKELRYDPEEGRVTNDPIANDYLKKEYRKGWVLNG
jgi:predicted dehydrogenase